jgi:hypothetical protein
MIDCDKIVTQLRAYCDHTVTHNCAQTVVQLCTFMSQIGAAFKIERSALSLVTMQFTQFTFISIIALLPLKSKRTILQCAYICLSGHLIHCC